MTRVRKNVATLAADDKTLVWYGRAVSALFAKDLIDPTSWRFMAAVHGAPTQGDPFEKPGEARPAKAVTDTYWDQCQHQTWYFLPWHRGYLAAFEAIVAKAIADLGGPEDWALPYWDYSRDIASRTMPAAFCVEHLDDKTKNPLWMQWGRTPDGNMGFGAGDVSIECLDHGVFAGAKTGSEHGFAGPVSQFAHFGSRLGLPNGRIEEVPHNQIHGQIGGLMGDPNYAALDPIFWLHHANIDRLWERWRQLYPAIANPTTDQWLKQSFALHLADGSPWTFTPAEMLDTTKILHGYAYEALEEDHSAPSILGIGAEPDMTEIDQTPADLAGATTQPVRIDAGAAVATLSVKAAPDTKLMGLVRDGQGGSRVFLNLENIAGAGETANYDVFVKNAQQAGDALLAGQISTFGLEQASKAGASGGSGLNKVLDISGLADPLGLSAQGDTNLEVSFKRRARPSSNFVPPARRDDTGSVEVGRVSLYYA